MVLGLNHDLPTWTRLAERENILMSQKMECWHLAKVSQPRVRKHHASCQHTVARPPPTRWYAVIPSQQHSRRRKQQGRHWQEGRRKQGWKHGRRKPVSLAHVRSGTEAFAKKLPLMDTSTHYCKTAVQKYKCLLNYASQCHHHDLSDPIYRYTINVLWHTIYCSSNDLLVRLRIQL